MVFPSLPALSKSRYSASGENRRWRAKTGCPIWAPEVSIAPKQQVHVSTVLTGAREVAASERAVPAVSHATDTQFCRHGRTPQRHRCFRVDWLDLLHTTAHGSAEQTPAGVEGPGSEPPGNWGPGGGCTDRAILTGAPASLPALWFSPTLRNRESKDETERPARLPAVRPPRTAAPSQVCTRLPCRGVPYPVTCSKPHGSLSSHLVRPLSTEGTFHTQLSYVTTGQAGKRKNGSNI